MLGGALAGLNWGGPESVSVFLLLSAPLLSGHKGLITISMNSADTRQLAYLTQKEEAAGHGAWSLASFCSRPRRYLWSLQMCHSCFIFDHCGKPGLTGGEWKAIWGSKLALIAKPFLRCTTSTTVPLRFGLFQTRVRSECHLYVLNCGLDNNLCL